MTVDKINKHQNPLEHSRLPIQLGGNPNHANYFIFIFLLSSLEYILIP